MPRPKRANRNDAEWAPTDELASYNLKRIGHNKAKQLKLSQTSVAKENQ